MSNPRILIVEDDDAIRRGVADALRFGGYLPVEAADGDEGLRCAASEDVLLVLLDVLLPKRNGFDVLEEIRRLRPTLPVIMLTARGEVEDRVRGLSIGADDYVVKPFSAKELLARVAAVLRRSPQRSENLGELRLPGRSVDFDRREIEFEDGRTVELSARESELLRYLARHRGRAVSRDELLSSVWGLDPLRIKTRTVDMHVARLRDRLRRDADDVELIVTVRSKGYRLEAEDES